MRSPAGAGRTGRFAGWRGIGRRRAQPNSAVVFSGLVGAGAGAAWTAHRGWRAASIGAIVGGVGLAISERIARRQQRIGELPPLWQRIAVSSALVAPLGWVGGRATKRGPGGRRRGYRWGRRPARCPTAEGRTRSTIRRGRRPTVRRAWAAGASVDRRQRHDARLSGRLAARLPRTRRSACWPRRFPRRNLPFIVPLESAVPLRRDGLRA